MSAFLLVVLKGISPENCQRPFYIKEHKPTLNVQSLSIAIKLFSWW